ncbi:MAG TPA: hypothetical protein GX513_03135 [Firmicutes bacterium]|nr:hypothetical protein [Bacillota bacterium]
MESTQAGRQPERQAERQAEVQAELEKAIQEAAVEGRLSCARALDIARRLQVPPVRVGEVADSMRVKIVACQLGCFR